MSDNDNYDFEEEGVEKDADFYDFNTSFRTIGVVQGSIAGQDDGQGSQASFTNARKKRVLPTSYQDRQHIEELLRVHHWADVTKRSALGDANLNNLEESKSFIMWRRVKGKSSIKKDLLNLYAATISITVNGWGVEQLVIVCLCLASTLAYSLAPSPSSPHLASQLDFHYLATSLVYLVTFGTQQTLKRRDAALQYLCAVRSLSCQMTLAFLLWNRDRPRPSEDFADRVVECIQRGCYHAFNILKIPTWNRTRHYFTHEGMRFRRAMKRRLYHHRKEFTKGIVELHGLFEEAKEANSIETHETTRLTDYTRLLNSYVEQLQLVKEYRTTNIARSYIRVFLIICPAMYGVYFSFVAGNIYGGAATTPLGFSVALMLVSIALLIILVNLERAMEDPCTTEFRGDGIEVDEELEDVNERIELIHEYCSDEWRVKLHQFQERLRPESRSDLGVEAVDEGHKQEAPVIDLFTEELEADDEAENAQLEDT